MTNLLLTIAITIISLLIIIITYIRVKNEKPDIKQSDAMSMDKLLDIVKYSLSDLVKEDNLAGLTPSQYSTRYKIRARTQRALRECIYGKDDSKIIVQDLIHSIIKDYVPTRSSILKVIPFDSKNLPVDIKFEILMYFYKEKYGKDALAKMIEEYNLARPRKIIEDKAQFSYAIIPEDIETIYNEKKYDLTYDVLLDILTVLIWQRYKGFGKIDTIREMNIDGLNCGASGSILNVKAKDSMKAPRSVWLYFQGKYLHLRFLSFGSEEELKRVIQLICRYKSPGPLTEKRGFLVNTMYDKSRVVAMRPPMGEYWVVFIRKFALKDVSLKKLIMNCKPNNAQLPEGVIKHAMRGQLTTGFTGRQGSGKTTMMTGAVYNISPIYTIRTLELAFEMYLREIYPERNIYSAQETEYVTAEAIQDVFKKSDAAISIVGEVASAKVAARMIQMGLVASLFTMFSHHATTADALVINLTNSLVSDQGLTVETAQDQVLQVVKLDVHLDFNANGDRFIDRITEIIPLLKTTDYPKYNPKDPEYSAYKLMAEYYRRRTDRVAFTTRDIIKYDKSTRTYYPTSWFTPELTSRMMSVMTAEQKEEFYKFYKDNFSKL